MVAVNAREPIIAAMLLQAGAEPGDNYEAMIAKAKALGSGTLALVLEAHDRYKRLKVVMNEPKLGASLTVTAQVQSTTRASARLS